MNTICQIQDNEKKTILQNLISDEDYNEYFNEANCETLHTQLYARLENLVHTNWQKHMAQFSDYIDRRGRLRP
jgi:hypothetical protein